MRRTFIYTVIALFLLYNVAAYFYKDSVAVPRYFDVEVSFIGDRSVTVWKADEAFRSRQLTAMEHKQYQPLIGGMKLSDGTTFPADKPLVESDLKQIAEDRLDKGMRMTVRDPMLINYLAGRGYKIRNPVKGEDGQTLFAGGEPVTKEVIDVLINNGITRVGVQGVGAPVSAQVGTMAMVILLFLGLAMALREIVWDPLSKIIAEREKEIEDGLELVKANAKEVLRIEDDRRERLRVLQKAYLSKLDDGRRTALKEADQTLAQARGEERKMKKEMFENLRKAVDETRTAVNADMAHFARDIADQVMGRKK